MSTSTSAQLQFIASHTPSLPAGNYAITVSQSASSAGFTLSFGSWSQTAGGFSEVFPALTRTFSVVGPRFLLAPSAIQSCYPPALSNSCHSTDLPSITLERGSLPWERNGRSVGASGVALPWLALLLFDENEAPTTSLVDVSVLSAASTHPVWPGLTLGPEATGQAKVIDVTRSVLEPLLPSAASLALLAHVRQERDSQGNPVGDDSAVILGNRLPTPGRQTVAHLVSVEGRYGVSGFDFGSAANTDPVRLVTLYQWEFSCAVAGQSMANLLAALNRNPSTLRLPPVADPVAESFAASGYVPMRQNLRSGGVTAGWYHGPLSPGFALGDLDVPVHAADELLRFDTSRAMFDVSYAAAWEVGRLLTLQNQLAAQSLYHWKRTHQHETVLRANTQLAHLPFPLATTGESVELPQAVSGWFKDLSLLKGIPYRYLVPDDRMLPAESLRFFQVDPVWLECLLDGAFSIGRVTTSDLNEDRSHITSPAKNPYPVVSGFLMKSFVVSGWPALGVSATGDAGAKLELLRLERLSENVLLCLFKGVVKQVDMYQQAGPIHSGFESVTSAAGGGIQLEKDLRPVATKTTPGNLMCNSASRVIDIAALAARMQTSLGMSSFTSADFAFQMIERTDHVSFSLATVNAGVLTAAQRLVNGHLIQAGANLAGIDFQGADLTGACLTGANLTGANLQDAQLTGIISGSILQAPALSPPWQMVNGYLLGPGANLSQANLANANLTKVNLSGANLSGANLSGANLTDASLRGANLAETNLNYANLTRTDVAGMQGTPSVSSPYQILKGRLIGPWVDLQNANLVDLDLSNSNLSNAKLNHADLTGTNLAATNLSGADLTGVLSGGVTGIPTLPPAWKLIAGYLIGPGANLVEANLANADLSGTTLAGACLLDANLRGVKSGQITGLPMLYPEWKVILGYLVGPGANLANADLRNADLTGCDLNGTNLSNAQLAGATLTGVMTAGIIGVPQSVPLPWGLVNGCLLGPGADLTGADLNGGNLQGIDLFGAVLSGVTSGGITGIPQSLPAGCAIVKGYLVGPGVDLTNADLSNSNLTGVDLTNATLTGIKSGGIQGQPIVSAPWEFKGAGSYTSSNFGGYPGTPLRTTTTPSEPCQPWMMASSGGQLISGPLSPIGKVSAGSLAAGSWSWVDITAQGLLASFYSDAVFSPETFGYFPTGFLVGPGADLSGANLSWLDLGGCDLTGADLSCANLSGTSLNKVILRDANLSEAIFFNTNLSGTDLTGANLAGIHAIGSCLASPAPTLPENWVYSDRPLGPGVNLTNVVWVNFPSEQINLKGAVLEGAMLFLPVTKGLVSGGCIGRPVQITYNYQSLSNCSSGMDVVNGYLCGPSVNLRGAQLAGVQFPLGLEFSGADFTNANLADAVFPSDPSKGLGTGLSNVTLTGANLRGVSMNGIYAVGSDFTGADLSGASLVNAQINNASFAGASLRGANITNASIAGAVFTDADITGIRYSTQTPYPDNTFPEPWLTVSSQAQVGPWMETTYYLVGPGAQLSQANLSMVDLSEADLTGADLQGANLSGANLNGTVLTRVQSGGIVANPSPTLAKNWQLLNGYLLGPDADLHGADLSNADLAGVDLSQADLTGVRSGGIQGVPLLPPRWAIVDGYLVGPETDLSGADLTNANLANLDLTNTDLRKAKLTGVKSGGIIGTPLLPVDWMIKSGYLLGPGADCGPGWVQIWKALPTLSGYNYVSGVAFSPDSSRVYLCDSMNNRLVVLDSRTLEPVAGASVATLPSPTVIAVSSDGSRIYVACTLPSHRGGVVVLDATTLQPLPESPGQAPYSAYAPGSMALSTSLDRLFVANNNVSVTVFDTSTMQTVADITAPILVPPPQAYYLQPSIGSVALTPDGTRLFFVVQKESTTGLLCTIETANPANVQTLPFESLPVGDQQLAITPDGERLFVLSTLSSTAPLTVVDVKTLKVIGGPEVGVTWGWSMWRASPNTPFLPLSVNAVTVSKDGAQVLFTKLSWFQSTPLVPFTPYYQSLFICDSKTLQGAPGSPFELSETPVSLAISADGTRIVVGGRTGVQVFVPDWVPA